MRHLFKRKPLSLLHEEMKSDNRLKRVLGPWSLTSLGVPPVEGTIQSRNLFSGFR